MIIKEICVKNFRSILDESLPCDCLTALVGRNGAGKSAFLRALEIFYDPSAKVTAEDFYAENTSLDIEIAVTFSDLTAEEFSDRYLCRNMRPIKASRAANITSIELPDAFDWREKGAVTGVKNQGNCGSCWGKKMFFLHKSSGIDF